MAILQAYMLQCRQHGTDGGSSVPTKYKDSVDMQDINLTSNDSFIVEKNCRQTFSLNLERRLITIVEFRGGNVTSAVSIERSKGGLAANNEIMYSLLDHYQKSGRKTCTEI